MTDVQEDRRPYALAVDDDALLRMDVCEILPDGQKPEPLRSSF